MGLPGDRDIHHGYPSALNVCYAEEMGQGDHRPVDLVHQRDVCLGPEHRACPVYLRHRARERQGDDGSPSQSYLKFFGLQEEPFSIVPLPRFAVQSPAQARAHAELRWVIDYRQGLGLMFGPIGAGKTVLCRTLFEGLQANPRYVPTLLLTPAYRSEYALMGDLLRHWGVTPRRRRSLQNLEAAAYQFLLQTVLQREQTVVLIVDEAQTLSYPLLRYVRKLLNWQEQGAQLLQVILAGQGGLKRKLRRVPDLHDRAVVEVTLGSMSPGDVQRMVTRRLRQAGSRRDLFTPGALHLISHYAEGMPRRVIVLCMQSMWLAYQQGERRIRADLVQSVADRLRAGDAAGREVVPLAAPWAEPVRRLPPPWVPRLVQALWARLTA
jgi:general secretion pathway protein A